MPSKAIETPYPLIDADPHASRVVRYFRLSDYAVWAGAAGAFPAALYFWGMFPLIISVSCAYVSVEMADPTRLRMRTPLRLGGLLGFCGGFLLAYQRSSGLLENLVQSYFETSYIYNPQHVSGVGRKISANMTAIRRN